MTIEKIAIEAKTTLSACNVAADSVQNLVDFATDAECITLSDYVRLTNDSITRLCMEIAHYNAVAGALYETGRTMNADEKTLAFLLHVSRVCEDYAHFSHECKCTIDARADHEKHSHYWRLDNTNELASLFWRDFEKRAENTPERKKIARFLYAVYVHRTKASKHYSIFECDGVVYVCACRAPIITTCKKSSREGDGYALRFCPSKAQKHLLIPHSLQLCTTTEFTEFCTENAPYNRGECAEMYLKKVLGYEVKKDVSPFWVDCDISAECASVKFESASIINEKTAEKVMEIFS